MPQKMNIGAQGELKSVEHYHMQKGVGPRFDLPSDFKTNTFMYAIATQ